MVHGCIEELGHRGYHIGCLHSYPKFILLHMPLSRSKLGLARENPRSPLNANDFYQTSPNGGRGHLPSLAGRAAGCHDICATDTLDFDLVLGRAYADHYPPQCISSTHSEAMRFVPLGQIRGERPVEMGMHLRWQPEDQIILTGTLASDVPGVFSVRVFLSFSFIQSR